MKEMHKKFLVLVATHGDEYFSIPLVKRLKRANPDRFDVEISNPLALKKRIRFIDCDLNRVAPGSKLAKQYEIRRANYIIEKSKQYEFVLDIHGADSNCGIFTIVTNPTPANLILAYLLPIKRIVIWGSRKNGHKFGSISRFVNCGVSIECGPKNSQSIKSQLSALIEKFLLSYALNQETNDRELYQVIGKVSEKDISKTQMKNLEDFKKVKLNDQLFFPILVNQYSDEKIVCYKMRKINFYERFSFDY